MIYELWFLVYFTANGDKADMNGSGALLDYLRTCILLKRKYFLLS